MPEALIPAPAFARNFKRLGLISARKKAKQNGLTQTANKFTTFANSNTDKPLKLYQPAHQRFYMISACLVCERPGLPDKIPNNGSEEKVSYIIRRLFPTTLWNSINRFRRSIRLGKNMLMSLPIRARRWKKITNKNSLEHRRRTTDAFFGQYHRR